MTTVPVTFAGLVDEAVQRAKDSAAPYAASRGDYESALDWVLVIVNDHSDPWKFIRATFRGAGTMDALAVELFKKQRAAENLREAFKLLTQEGFAPAWVGGEYIIANPPMRNQVIVRSHADAIRAVARYRR